jgi:uncharacterized protein
MKKILVPLISALLLAAGCGKQSAPAPSPAATAPQATVTPETAVTQTMTPYTDSLQVGQQILRVQIMRSPAEMAQGLSGREPLTDEQGMLFDFGTPLRPGFWMKEMKFDLDFIWVYRQQIVDITPNVPAPKSPSDPLPLYYPGSNVDEVLEVNAGWANAHKIKIGDKVSLR